MSIQSQLVFNATYTEEDIKKVRLINQWIANKGEGAATKLSGAASIKDGTRSSILNGKYISSPSRFLDKMLDVIGRHEVRESSLSDIPFTQTSIANSIQGICERTHNDRDFGLFIGRVGIGKTTACRNVLKEIPTAILIEAFEGIDHSTLIGELIIAVGLPISKGSVSAQTAQLIRSIKGTNRLFIIDEADKLNKRSLGALRRLSDNAGVGIVLIGTPELLPMVGDPDGKYGQISSRIGYWTQPVNSVKPTDAIAMIRNYAPKPIPDDILKAFCIYCEGSARGLKNLMRNTYRAAEKNNSEVTIELIEQIHTITLAGRGIKTVKHGADWLNAVNEIFDGG